MKINVSITSYHNLKPKAIPVFLPNGKIAGKVRDGEFTKTIYASKHFLRRPPAIAFDVAVIERARELGATILKVKEKENNLVYSLSIERFFQEAFSLNRGCGEQLACLLKDWQTDKKPCQLELVASG